MLIPGLVAYKFCENRFKANIPAVSTFRAKYTSANMGGEEGLEDLADEAPHPTGAQANGIVVPDEVESQVPPHEHTEAVVPVLMLGEDSILVD